jgi:hypothetical protein
VKSPVSPRASEFSNLLDAKKPDGAYDAAIERAIERPLVKGFEQG